jgi:hypothetical protein
LSFRSEEERADAELFSENVRGVMARALGVPASQLSADDIQLTGRAAGRGYPVDHATLGVHQFRRLGVKSRDLLPLVDAFIDLDSEALGTIMGDSALKSAPQGERIASRNGIQEDQTAIPVSAAFTSLVRNFCHADGRMDMMQWVLLHIALTGRAPGHWATLRQLLQEAIAHSGRSQGNCQLEDPFLLALAEAMSRSQTRPAGSAALLEGFPQWVSNHQQEWKKTLSVWIPSTMALDRMWYNGSE